ncbi:MAG TPA: PKD domain-containing protein [Chitinophagaceae bacterium]|nr:PKD domain-containing protein [Chitinophagaceae bacterium]
MAKRLYLSIIHLFFFLLAFVSFSKGQSYYSLDFVENKGQWEGNFKYRAEAGNGAFFIDPRGYTILQHQQEDFAKLSEKLHGHGAQEAHVDDPKNGNPHRDFEKLVVRSHALKVMFLGSSNDPEVVPEKQREGYDNYFLGNDKSKWKSGIRSFSILRFKEVYPGIDVKYYTEGGQLKYDFIVKPGSDISRINLKYDGAEKISASRNGDLLVKTSVGEVKELVPYAYQVANGIKKEVKCEYVINGQQVSFKIKGYDKDAELIIDPTLIFSTYTGSRSGNWGFTATPGADGSFFAGGIVFNGGGYPVTAGAFQTTFQGGGQNLGIDIGITRFSPTGNARIYSTYLGGSADEFPHSLIADGAGNLVVLGRTTSPNFPTTATFGPGGAFDIFVTKLNAAGTALIGSIKIGGTGDDGGNIDASGQPTCGSLLYNYGDNARSEVVLDAANNVYVAASTKSSNFPTNNAFQTTLGGKQDAVVIKLTPNLNTVLFSTYLGGAEDDAGFVLDLNPTDGNIFVAGGTASANFPKASNAYGNAIDGYVAVIANNGSTLITSKYFGTASLDIIYGIQFDAKGFPYIMGISLGSWTVTSNAAFSNPGSKQFVSKLQPDLSNYVYSTVFGAPSSVPNISPVAFLVDRCENVYISGWGGKLNPCNSGSCFDSKTSGTAGMPVTPDAIKSTTDGRDFYFFVMEKDATRQLYGSFFGQTGGEGDHVDGGTSRFDTRGAIYQAICANCLGNNACSTSPITQPLPTTPGVVAPVNGALGSGSGGDCNLAAVKILFDYQGVIAGLQSSIGGVPNDSTGCASLTVDFTDTIGNAVSYEWDFGDGTPVVSTTSPDVSHTFTNTGSYRVRLIAIDNSKCIPRDTAYKTIIARSDKALTDFTSVKLPPCASLNYRFDNLSIAPPGEPFGTKSFVWDFGDGNRTAPMGNGSVNHTYAGPGTFNVRLVMVDTGYCNFPDSVTKVLRVAPNVDARFSTPPAGCVPHTAVFTNTSLAGVTFQWDFGDGTSFTGPTPPPKIYSNVGTYTVRLIAIDPNTCNLSDTAFQQITVRPGPVANFSYSPNPPQENTPTQFTNLSTNADSYKWLFGDGDSSTLVNPVHQFRQSGSFQTCLIAINEFGCTDTVCQNVDAVVLSLLDVPNAFTPNGDGINDRVYVRGFGIAKMVWRIYNRQGLLVFQSVDQNNGWDGKYKGTLQPMDAYGYTLEVQFADGTRATKKGDITLLR